MKLLSDAETTPKTGLELLEQIEAGRTWHFQAWNRDFVGPRHQRTNAGPGLGMAFVP